MRGKGNYRGNNRPGCIPEPKHAHPLVREFFAHMNAKGAIIREVAQRAGVGIDTMRFWRWRHVPRLDVFEAALNTVGFKLVIVPIEDARDSEAA